MKPGAKRGLFVGLALDDFFAAVEAIGADVMRTMHFTGGLLDRDCRRREKVVRAVHVALGRRLFVLLNGHGCYSGYDVIDVKARKYAIPTFGCAVPNR